MVGNVGAYYDILTYSAILDYPVGTIVEIPVGKKTSLGVIVKAVAKPAFICKAIIKSVVDQPIPGTLIKLQQWMAQYYATKSGITWQTILPARVGVKPRQKIANFNTDQPLVKRTNIVLNPDQIKAAAQIRKVSSGNILLHGITGSGKTEIYKTIATDVIQAGQSVILLVPEISLTTQLVNEFKSRFNNVIVTHSAMTAAERNLVWRQILFNSEPMVIIGPRSALFMPVRNLGLVIIDECHEPSYKQESAPRYNTVTVASKLCQLAKARLILGSATPSISDYYLARKFNRSIVELNHLARVDAVCPTTRIIDLTNRDNYGVESKLFTKLLLESIHQTLAKKQQILLFHNRRGSASITLCENCGWTAACPNCFIPLTLHNDKFQLICHICGYTAKPPLQCPDCGEPKVVYKGIGTKRIEDEVKKLFPAATVRRFDGDTAKGEAVQDVYDELKSGQTNIIIGTQTIAKGLDLPHLSLVGVIQADAGLAMPDFSASERTFQLVAQVCGRVGRSSLPTTAIIQTYQPNAPAVKYGAIQNYQAFYDEEIKNRQHGHFPPFAYLLKISCAYKTERGATVAAGRLAGQLRQKYGSQIKLLGPTPAFYERLRGLYRWQIIVRSSHRGVLEQISQEVPPAKWQIELDPISLL